MNKPLSLKTRIFLDSGDPQETKEAISLLGFLDGQTTNPSLVAKNPELRKKIDSGEKLSAEDVHDFYRGVIKEISSQIPQGSVSVEVYADATTSKEEIVKQAREMDTWVHNAHIKLPITPSGLEAAHILSQEEKKLNMTLCFSQQQAAAVYAATESSMKGDIFISPFIGRFDDRGENGMSFIENIVKMFSTSNGHVEVLAASVRTYEHFAYCLALGVDIITAPLKVLKQWKEHNLEIPGKDFQYEKGELKHIPYEEISLSKKWDQYNIQHDLTDAGLEKFAKDWKSLIKE